MGKPCGVLKMIQIFQALLHMTSAGIWQKPTCTSKKFEWFDIQLAVENKDASWNSAFSRSEGREKIHRNQTKQKMSTSHGPLTCKGRIGQCPKTNWTVPVSHGISICREHSMWVWYGRLQWNFDLYFIFIVLSFSFMLWYNCILNQLRSYKTCLSWK